MKVKELIKELEQYDWNDEVYFQDNELWRMRIDTTYTDRKYKTIDWEQWFKEIVILDYNVKTD